MEEHEHNAGNRLIKYQQELKEQAHFIRSVTDSIPGIVTITKYPTGEVEFNNRDTLELLGFDVREIINMEKQGRIKLIHPDDVPALKSYHARFDRMTNEEENRVEYRIKNKKGDWVWLDVRGRVFLRNMQGRVTHTLHIGYDITDRKKAEKAEKALKESEQQLKQLVKQKDEFIGIASHELKTPLTSIKTYAEVLLERFEQNNDKSSAALMEKLNRQLDRLTKLTRDLLDTSKISDGNLDLFLEKFDLNQLIAERIEELGRISGKHKIIFNQGQLPLLLADNERIGQVLTNLISNAIKYSPAGGNIIITTKTSGHNIKVSVQDSGIGIPQHAQHKVFERFFRLGNIKMQDFSGMGLGLYISAEIVRRHGGNIKVTSKEGKGSTFSFTIPYDYLSSLKNEKDHSD